MENLMTWPSTAGLAVTTQPEILTARKTYPSIERREKLSSDEFFAEYVTKDRPVVVSGALSHCPAVARWTFDHLRSSSGQRIVKLKQGLNDSGVAGLKTLMSGLGDYLDRLEQYASQCASNNTPLTERPPYLHDVPLLDILPDAAGDLEGFPAEYFPRWYRSNWLQFAQFFLGPKHSLTPLHFDCLLTHNLFFQIAGRKRFILLPYNQLPFCYRYRWRWCEVDAENPDFVRHPLYRETQPQECVVEPGDMLYMPPGMLHHVRSLDAAMSFNVDWHTQHSAVQGVLAWARGMPLKNVYYNAIITLGLSGGIAATRLLPWYRSYLNYVS